MNEQHLTDKDGFFFKRGVMIAVSHEYRRPQLNYFFRKWRRRPRDCGWHMSNKVGTENMTNVGDQWNRLLSWYGINSVGPSNHILFHLSKNFYRFERWFYFFLWAYCNDFCEAEIRESLHSWWNMAKIKQSCWCVMRIFMIYMLRLSYQSVINKPTWR